MPCVHLAYLPVTTNETMCGNNKWSPMACFNTAVSLDKKLAIFLTTLNMSYFWLGVCFVRGLFGSVLRCSGAYLRLVFLNPMILYAIQ